MLQEEEVENLWKNMDPQMKANIKEAILSKLADPSPLIWRGTASCVSAIAQIEIP